MPQLISPSRGGEGAFGEADLIWIPAYVTDICRSEASSKFPLESGGAFMGWWADDHNVVISAAIGPGPDAYHGSHAFQPDQDWQLEQIASHYEASDRRETYIGDWHSHPNAKSGSLSWTDRGVLKRIINTLAARAPTPIMVVLYGPKDEWSIIAWRAHLIPRQLLWPRLCVHETPLHRY